MRRKTAALLMFVGSVILSACTGRDSTSPRGIGADQANFAATPGPSATCDFTATKAAARNYFTSSRDPALDTLNAMSKAYGTSGTPTSTGYGFALGRIVAKERLTTATTNSAAGAVFLLDVLQCMTDPTTNTKLVIPDSFAVHAALVLSSGIWEVRGAGNINSQFPAAGRVIDASSHVRAFGLPRWGAEPKDSANWPGTTQYVVYGYPTTPGALIVGSPSNINTNENPASSFELGSIPAATDKSQIRVGVCIATDNANTNTANRIVHNNTQILNPDTLTQLCDFSNTNFVASASSAVSWYVAAVHRFADVVAPPKAYAQDLTDCTNCIGGLPSDWSPFSASGLAASSIHLAYATGTTPNDSTVSQTDTSVVTAMIGSVPVPGVAIAFSIANNSGQPGGATFQDGSTTLTGTSNAAGTVTFIYRILKAGGYTLTTAGSIDGFTVGNTLTTTLNIQNK